MDHLECSHPGHNMFCNCYVECMCPVDPGLIISIESKQNPQTCIGGRYLHTKLYLVLVYNKYNVIFSSFGIVSYQVYEVL